MPDFKPEKAESYEDAVAEIRQEFDRGLQGRVDTLDSMLAVLAEHFDGKAVETFFYQAHSLKGTAGSFEAFQLIEPATRLAELAREWLRTAAVTSQELAQARRELKRLSQGVAEYLGS
jgi:chemotaxis protein histidine kinase CheA